MTFLFGECDDKPTMRNYPQVLLSKCSNYTSMNSEWVTREKYVAVHVRSVVGGAILWCVFRKGTLTLSGTSIRHFSLDRWIRRCCASHIASSHSNLTKTIPMRQKSILTKSIWLLTSLIKDLPLRQGFQWRRVVVQVDSVFSDSAAKIEPDYSRRVRRTSSRLELIRTAPNR